MAHKFPVYADDITGTMTKLNARAVRRGFPGDEMIYTNISEIFQANLALLEGLRTKTLNTLETLDYDISNKEVILMLEDLCEDLLDDLYQSNIWSQYADYYMRKDKVMQFDQNFDKFNAPLYGADTGDDD